MDLVKKLPVKGDDKYIVILEMLSVLRPFSELRTREKEVLSEFIKVYHRYIDLPVGTRNKLVFDYDVVQNIADVYKVSKNVVYSIISSLKAKGFIVEDEDGKRSLNQKIVIPNIDSITFKFE